MAEISSREKCLVIIEMIKRSTTTNLDAKDTLEAVTLSMKSMDMMGLLNIAESSWKHYTHGLASAATKLCCIMTACRTAIVMTDSMAKACNDLASAIMESEG